MSPKCEKILVTSEFNFKSFKILRDCLCQEHPLLFHEIDHGKVSNVISKEGFKNC